MSTKKEINCGIIEVIFFSFYTSCSSNFSTINIYVYTQKTKINICVSFIHFSNYKTQIISSRKASLNFLGSKSTNILCSLNSSNTPLSDVTVFERRQKSKQVTLIFPTTTFVGGQVLGEGIYQIQKRHLRSLETDEVF